MLSDIDLIKVIKQNPEKGLDLLMKNYIKLIYSLVHNKLYNKWSKEDIEECVSDVFYNFYIKLDTYNITTGSIKNFLCSIAKNKAIDYFRVQSNKPKASSIESDEYDKIYDFNDDVEKKVIDNEISCELVNGINSLGTPDSEIFIRKYYYGESTKSISQALEIKENTIDKKISRGHHKLRHFLEAK